MKSTTRNKGGEFSVDTNQIDLVRQAFIAKYYVKVGILGDAPHSKNRLGYGKMVHGKERDYHRKSKGSTSSLTNVEIGFIHEYGVKSKNIPRRSFLRMPLTLKSRHVDRAMNVLWGQYCEGEISLHAAYKKLGIFAEGIIQRGFASKGYGQWDNLKHRKGSPLIDTGQLRKSITSQVVGG